ELVDLSSAEILFEGEKSSKISIDLEILDTNGLDITPNYSLYLSFKNLVIKRAKGWFDQLILDFKTDTITLDVFENWKSGSVFLDDPKLTFSIKNSIGIPFNGSISTFDAVTNGNGSTIVPIEYSNAFGNSFSVDYPSSNQLEGYINSIFTLNGSNSNLRNIIEISPTALHYGFNFVANHSYDLDKAGFISDT